MTPGDQLLINKYFFAITIKLIDATIVKNPSMPHRDGVAGGPRSFRSFQVSMWGAQPSNHESWLSTCLVVSLLGALQTNVYRSALVACRLPAKKICFSIWNRKEHQPLFFTRDDGSMVTGIWQWQSMVPGHLHHFQSRRAQISEGSCGTRTSQLVHAVGRCLDLNFACA